jgi:opacity protein-like surface antigen
MKKKSILAIMLFLFLCPTMAGATGWSGNINGLLGIKMLDDSDWGDFDDQFEMGVMADFKMDSWPLSLCANLLYSNDSTSDYHDNEINDTYYYTYYAEDATTVEFNVGIKKIWTPAERLNFYVAGGLAVIYGEMEITRADNLAGTYRDTDSEDDTGLGGWGAVGCYVNLSRHFNVGLDLRYSTADIDMYDDEIDAGGFHAGLLVGYAW